LKWPCVCTCTRAPSRRAGRANIDAWTGADATDRQEPARIEKVKIIQENEIDWSDSIFSLEGYNRPVVIESHKLVFFPVAKNGCTVFKKLFRRMMGESDWLEKNPHAPSKTDGLKHVGHFSRDKQLEMMTSPNWTRAIFVRDPLERTLSAYLDKGLFFNCAVLVFLLGR